MNTEGDELERLEHALLESLQRLLAGTEWAPPEGGIITDAVIVCGWRELNGDSGRVLIDIAPPWSTEGLLLWALRTAEEANTSSDEDEDASG